MSDQIFKTPGFYPREIDLSATSQSPTGTPAGLIGSSRKGPAFVPVTVGTFSDFQTVFGGQDPRHSSTFAAEKFLESRTALTFVRVLGAGSNETEDDMDTTRTRGTVRNAGFRVVSGSVSPYGSAHPAGVVYFLGGRHQVSNEEPFGFPMFTDNNSQIQNDPLIGEAFLTRAVLFSASGSRIQVLDGELEGYDPLLDGIATVAPTIRTFKLAISSSLGSTFGNDEGFAGVRILTASFDPDSDNYIAKVLNTNPEKFASEQHFLYTDFAVDRQVAEISDLADSVFVARGSNNVTTTGGDTTSVFADLFGRFDTRYTTPSTPWFISQPFGQKEYRLFKIWSKDDGSYANNKYKVSVVGLKKSTDQKNKFGTFSLVVRAFDDTDFEPKVIEQFTNLTLDPTSENYIAKVIGDSFTRFNFDVVDPRDRRLQEFGTHVGRSNYIRVEMDETLLSGYVPDEAIPFGFEGYSVVATNPLLSDLAVVSSLARLETSSSVGVVSELLSSIVPPLPFRFKATRGDVDLTGAWRGQPGNLEVVDRRLYWGVKDSRNNNVANPNTSSEPNRLVEAYTKFQGIEKLDTVVTGSGVSRFNDNKFTLARVALYNGSVSDVTASVDTHMRQAAYIRNAQPDGSDYTVEDGALSRITFATLLQKAQSAADFNRFSDFTKFTAVMAGGFDGVNVLDKNTLNDRATSTDSRGSVFGNANTSFVSPGFNFNQSGAGASNNAVTAYRLAADVITNPFATDINVLAVPGQREPLVVDYVSEAVSENGLILFLMDVPSFNANLERVFDGELATTTETRIDLQNTADRFEARNVANTYVASYFPNIIVEDATKKRVTLPASNAALAAIGYNDKVSFPWFAPAGFNRAALDFVQRTATRINQADRERLSDARINPIVKFPRDGYVIMSQFTLDSEKTVLSRINVKRLLLDLKRQAILIGNALIFEQNDIQTRSLLADQLRRVLSSVQTNRGLDGFDVVCDGRNNTSADVENKRMNCQIRILPTNSVEFIAIDFIITNSGVEFV